MKSFKSIIILLLSAVPVLAQPNLDFRMLGRKALSNGEYTAAAYFLYADYLRDTVSFEDHIVTAFLLTNEAEYDKAEGMLAKVQDTIRTEHLSDSLKYFYHTGLAELAKHKHNYVDAINYTKDIKQDVWHYKLRASCYESLGLYEQAVHELLEMEKLKVFDVWLLNVTIGEVYRKSGDYVSSISYYEKAKSYDPSNVIAYYLLGWAYELSGDDESALKYYNQGISLPDNDYAYIYLMRGELYLRQGKIDLAKEDFNKILLIDKTLGDGSSRMYALHFLGRDFYSLQWMDRLINNDPNDPGLYYDKACLCGRMGLIEDSNKALETAFMKGYREFAHIEHDDDMDPIRDTDQFKETFSKYYAIYQDELSRLKF